MALPPPSTLTLLSSLPGHTENSKVRFLGCISSYNSTNSTLTLTHAFPSDSTPVEAVVDVQLVLQAREQGLFTRGNWVNVLGYFQGSSGKTRSKKQSVKVQAIALWGVGPTFDLAKYEKTAADMIKMREQQQGSS